MSEYTTYAVEEKKRDGILILLLFLVGWVGADKWYAAKDTEKGALKGGWKFFLIKFLYCCIGIGFLWNIFDIVKAFQMKYQLDFREYFR